MKKPYVLVTVSGGVANLAIAESAFVDVEILDYDNLNESIGSNEALCLSKQELAFIRKHDTPAFVAEVERLLVSDCCGEARKDGLCTNCGKPSLTVDGL